MAWAIAWSPDAKHIAAATDRGTVMIWEVGSGKKLRSLMGGGAAVHSIDWSPDGDRLASGEGEGIESFGIGDRTMAILWESGEATIRIWDWRTGKTLLSLAVPTGPVSSLDWHPDGRQLLAVYGGLAARRTEDLGHVDRQGDCRLARRAASPSPPSARMGAGRSGATSRSRSPI